jgi:ribose-phosphate pyrophosphokinase
MNPKFKVVNSTGRIVLPEIGKFPGGEIRVRIPADIPFMDEVRIEAYLFSSDDIMTLIMLTDALRRYNSGSVHKIRLTMPYVPYARQDRVCNEGEAFSIKAFASIINMLNFSSIVITDPHSDVTTALIDRCVVANQSSAMGHHGELKTWYLAEEAPMYLVAPDAGSVKKIYQVAKDFPKFKGIIFAEKVRDVATGKILHTKVAELPPDVADAKLLIVDDICDFGTTFVELSKVLRPHCREINLFVTHGIFSGGKNRMLDYFDNVWCSVDFREFE